MDIRANGDTLLRPASRLTRRGLWLGAAGLALGAAAAQLPSIADAKKKKKKKQKFQTVRQTVTQTFSSAVPFDFPVEGVALPYPSTIAVSGLTNGVISDVNVILSDVTHQNSPDIDILLVAPDGRQAQIMSDTGDATDIDDVDLTLDDEAAAALPNAQLSSGTFRPTNNGADIFPAPAPVPNGNVALSAFDGADPNGNWQVFVLDDQPISIGDIAGWALEITAEVDVQVPVKKKKKKNKK